MKLYVNGKYTPAVVLYITRIINNSISYLTPTLFELVLHTSCLPSKVGCMLLLDIVKSRTNIIRKPPLYFSPSLECKQSPIPDISTHFCQPPHWAGALSSGSLVTGPAGDARVSSACTFLYLYTCNTGLPRPAQVPSGAPDLTLSWPSLQPGRIDPPPSYQMEYLTSLLTPILCCMCIAAIGAVFSSTNVNSAKKTLHGTWMDMWVHWMRLLIPMDVPYRLLIQLCVIFVFHPPLTQ